MYVRLVTMIAAFIVCAACAAPLAQERPVPGKDVLMPQVIRDVKPDYTAAAKKARIQGNVKMEAVVREDGSVGEVKVTKSLDTQHGLDEEAVKAMKKWEFKPGTKDGKPVPVAVEVEMTFTLK
jgi:periplasmic protein TonB